ncbi:MAG: hypothetical protein JWO06_274 [Bacteroidota bacterium]|nr:hypothetical protein [Bacteroidota bacterium]
MNIFNQNEFDIRFEWGMKGVEVLAPISDVIIIVDVLSFSTCVDIATGNGALVYPYRWKDESAAVYATQIGGAVAGKRENPESGYSLSPSSLITIPTNTKLVLPSPNGATLSLATGKVTTICGCLRNARAIANYSQTAGTRIAVIAAGELWPDSSLRPCFEDLIAAGAIISFPQGSLSPESKAALSVFSAYDNLYEEIRRCSSGKELLARGFENDVKIASEFNVSLNVPLLTEGAYRPAGFLI